MNRQEAVALARYVKACCPQQAIDEYTPDAWHDLLGDLDIDACRQAAACVARRQPFVAPAEIRAEVRAERARRLTAIRSDKLLPHGDVADNSAMYLKQIRERVQALAAMEHGSESPTLGAHDPQGIRPPDGWPDASPPINKGGA